MSVVESKAKALPRTPECYTKWQETNPEYCRAYDLAFNAEVYAQAEDNDKIVSARVVGYLLIELFARSKIITMGPYDCVVKEVTSQPRASGEGSFALIFEIGKRYRDRFLRLCASLSFPTSLSVLISHSSDNHHRVPRILTASFTR